MAFKSNSSQKLLIILLFWVFWAFPALAWAVTPLLPAQPSQYVVDLAGVLDADSQARLNTMLRDLEAKTTAQVVVLTLNSLEGAPIEEFSHQTAVKWGIGQKGKDNGVLLTVAVKDHKYRIEVGYGLEGVLPDSLVGSIGRQYLVPNFRSGNFAGGIDAAVTEIAKTISGGKVGQGVGSTGEAAGGYHGETKPGTGTGTHLNLALVLFIFLTIALGPIYLVFIVVRAFIRGYRRRGSDRFWFLGSGGGGSGGGGSSSDDDSFSGGGGDFGGGGASGDW